MYKILFSFIALLSGCSLGGYETIQPQALNNVVCPKIQMAHREKEFELNNEEDDISVSSILSIKDAKCIADKDHIRLTTKLHIASELDSTIESGDVIALPLSYHISTILPNDHKEKIVKKKIFFTAHEFIANKKEDNLIEERTIKILKSDVVQKKAFVKIGFSKD